MFYLCLCYYGIWLGMQMNLALTKSFQVGILMYSSLDSELVLMFTFHLSY